jgi:hypothetical protein
MTFTTKEIDWLCCLVADMRVSLSHFTLMYCDNQSSIQIAHNLVFMNELSILRSIVIILIMAPLIFLLSLLLCRLQISLPSRILFPFLFVGKLSILIVFALWVWGEMLRNISYFVLFIKGRLICLFSF